MNKFVEDVNRIVEARFGFSVHDFADFPFFDYYEDSFDPDGYDYQNAVDSCAEDFIYEVEQEYHLVRGAFA